MRCIRVCCFLLLTVALPLTAATAAHAAKAPSSAFRSHLADPTPCTDARRIWLRHYAPYTRQLKARDGRVLRLFNTVAGKMVAAGLPTEYALIPFVESHYKPDARSVLGPAGLWQFTRQTARNHGLSVAGKHDERMDATRSTDAAIRYLRYLHRKFKGDEESVLMAFNAGEGRLFASRRKSGKRLSAITHVYPDKIQAIACNIVRQGA